MQWVRQGTVSVLNQEDMTVRVVFDGLDTSVSEELSILVPPSNGQSYYTPEVGDTVLCLFTGTQGFVVGMLQAATPSMSAKDWGLWFDDENQITFSNGKMTIIATEVEIQGNLKVSGEVSAGGKVL